MRRKCTDSVRRCPLHLPCALKPPSPKLRLSDTDVEIVRSGEIQKSGFDSPFERVCADLNRNVLAPCCLQITVPRGS